MVEKRHKCLLKSFVSPVFHRLQELLDGRGKTKAKCLLNFPVIPACHRLQQ